MIILVTGGQRSGKSSFAESVLKNEESVAYIATARMTDEEMALRVKKHQEDRPRTWTSLERNYNLAHDIKEEAMILECVGTLVSNRLYDKTKDMEKIPPDLAKDIEDEIFEEVKALVDLAKNKDKKLVLVSNEVGLALTPMNNLARTYTDMLGRLNQGLAKLADEVYLVVAGIEVKIK